MPPAPIDPRTLVVPRPHRADARRNFDALLVAARDEFADHGAQAPLEDVARRAGVGIGTLYRNFPTRQHLFDAIYVEEVAALCAVADEVADRDPWDALAAFLHRFVGFAVTKHTMAEAINRESEVFHASRAALFAAGEPILARAQQAGVVRTDAELDDVLRLAAGVSRGIFRDEAQRGRVLALALDGLRPGPGR